jgi:predicted nucleotidyltransferase
MVYQKQVDVGATYYSPPDPKTGENLDARVRVKSQYPDIEKTVKIIGYTQEIPNDPWVFRHDMPQDIQKKICDALIKFQATPKGKKALFETNSAEGLSPVSDSDYDVRFIYAQKPSNYIRVFDKRDVIEEPIDGLLDISGWDIKKALGLLRKSNPALMEWLSSPIIYRQHAAIEPLRALAQASFLPLSSCHHYLSMARQDINKLVIGSDIRLKKYLYMFRALLATQWVIANNSQPPMAFIDLVNRFLPSGDIREQIDELLVLKSQVLESEHIPPQEELDAYLLSLFARLEKQLPAASTPVSVDVFDKCLLDTLHMAYPQLNL